MLNHEVHSSYSAYLQYNGKNFRILTVYEEESISCDVLYHITSYIVTILEYITLNGYGT